MFERTYYATHPDMMECVSNEELRDRYLIQDLFREGECVLNYTHADRFVIGGVLVGAVPVMLPAQTEPPSAAGHPFLERRELAIVNVGKVEGTVSVDGESFTLGNKDCLYVTMGAAEVIFAGEGARYYLASCPAHKAFATRKLEAAAEDTAGTLLVALRVHGARAELSRDLVREDDAAGRRPRDRVGAR